MVEVYSIIIVFHVLAVIVAVGAVTVTDYLHLIGLRRKNLERQLRNIYPSLSKLIMAALSFIVLSGFTLLYLKPEVLESPLFIAKLVLVVIVTLNGFYLQKKVYPNLDLCVMKGTKYCPQDVLYASAISGGISIVTWYSIVILSLTKNLGYTLNQFILVYLMVLFVVISVAFYFEKKARTWR